MRGEVEPAARAVSGARKLNRRRPIRQIPDWKSAVREARRGLAEAWERGEETGPWVFKLRELLNDDPGSCGNRWYPDVYSGPASSDGSDRNAAS
jgi:hypothetical protein